MEEEEEQRTYYEVKQKKNNNLQFWGNTTTMNINSMIHTNILQSPYFKNELFKLKTYHEVIDEIYYKVDHLEPWEKGSRKTSGQVGMCGGVRGVGAGGIVSTSYCLLFKLFTLKLTRKQLKGLLDHPDSPFIRALGFMYIRYCMPPSDFWEWYEPYLEDEEELDVKAGSGCVMTIGQLVRCFLLKIDWYGTLFPRIPVPIQKDIQQKLTECNLCDDHKRKADEGFGEAERYSKTKREEADSRVTDDKDGFGEAERYSRMRRDRGLDGGHSRERESFKRRSRSHSRDRHRSSRHGSRDHSRRSRSRDRNTKHSRSRNGEERKRRSRSRSQEKVSKRQGKKHRSKSRERSSKSKRKHRSRSRSRSRDRMEKD